MILWNKFRITYSNYKLFINFNVLIETNRLDVFRIGKKRLKRSELIYSLQKEGLSNKDISEYFNNNSQNF